MPSSHEPAFKRSHSLQERLDQYRRVTETHPNKIPVVVEKSPISGRRSNPSIPDIDKNKYLVPGDLTVSQFMTLIRKRIKLGNDQALFIYVDGVLPPASAMFSTVYAEHRDEDGFLYVMYAGESSFGFE